MVWHGGINLPPTLQIIRVDSILTDHYSSLYLAIRSRARSATLTQSAWVRNRFLRLSRTRRALLFNRTHRPFCWRSVFLDARLTPSGEANPRPGVKRWDGDQVATLALCLEMAQEG